MRPRGSCPCDRGRATRRSPSDGRGKAAHASGQDLRTPQLGDPHKQSGGRHNPVTHSGCRCSLESAAPLRARGPARQAIGGQFVVGSDEALARRCMTAIRRSEFISLLLKSGPDVDRPIVRQRGATVLPLTTTPGTWRWGCPLATHDFRKSGPDPYRSGAWLCSLLSAPARSASSLGHRVGNNPTKETETARSAKIRQGPAGTSPAWRLRTGRRSHVAREEAGWLPVCVGPMRVGRPDM